MTHSLPRQPRPDFPILDSDRPVATTELGRVVIADLGIVEAFIDEIDDWCTMPIRLAHDHGIGIYLELGPYNLDIADIRALRAAIAAYDQAIARAIDQGG